MNTTFNAQKIAKFVSTVEYGSAATDPTECILYVAGSCCKTQASMIHYETEAIEHD